MPKPASAFRIRADERIFICGRTGSGKTFLAMHLLLPVSRLVVIDPKASLAAWELEDWGEAARRRLRNGEPVRTRAVEPEEAMEALAEAYEAGNVIVYIDEVYGLVPPGSRPDPVLTAIWTRGRERKVAGWASTQRPTWVPLFVMSEADHFFIFTLNLAEDRARVAGFVGEGVMQPPRHPHGFYHYSVREGRLRYFKRLEATLRPETVRKEQEEVTHV